MIRHVRRVDASALLSTRAALGALQKVHKERKKRDNPREGWEDGTPPPAHQHTTQGFLRRSSQHLTLEFSTWSTWSAVISLTSRAGELRSAPSGPDDRSLAAACSTAPLPPRKRRAQIQEAAHQAAECCTGLQRRLWRCGAVSPPCPRSRRAGARRHGPPAVAGGASAHAALRSAAHGPRHAKPTLSLPERLSAEGLASAHSSPPRPCPPRGRASNAGTPPSLEFRVPADLILFRVF